MRKSKYDEMVSICWRDVLRCLEWALSVRLYNAERWIDEVEADIKHSYPDYLKNDMRRALSSCECVFHQFELLNALRGFLRYKPKTKIRLELERLYSFYGQYKRESPSSDSLAASTTRGHEDNG